MRDDLERALIRGGYVISRTDNNVRIQLPHMPKVSGIGETLNEAALDLARYHEDAGRWVRDMEALSRG